MPSVSGVCNLSVVSRFLSAAKSTTKVCYSYIAASKKRDTATKVDAILVTNQNGLIVNGGHHFKRIPYIFLLPCFYFPYCWTCCINRFEAAANATISA